MPTPIAAANAYASLARLTDAQGLTKSTGEGLRPGRASARC